MTGADLPDLSRLVVLDDRLREVAADRAAVEEARSRAWLLGYAGTAERALARPHRALGAFRASRWLYEELGDRRGVAVALIRIGEAHRCADDLGASERVLRGALQAIDRREQKSAADLVKSTTAALEWARAGGAPAT